MDERLQHYGVKITLAGETDWKIAGELEAYEDRKIRC
jgi:hypothetical protein